MKDKHEAFLSLGTNLGDRQGYLKAAIESLKKNAINLLALSPIYETEPIGVLDQPNFLNMVIKIETDLTPEELLKVTMEIEQEQHRVRVKRWGPRTLDIDILFYDDLVIDNPPTLLVPHPRASERAFILLPLNDIAPNFIHPILKVPIKELAIRVEGREGVTKLQKALFP